MKAIFLILLLIAMHTKMSSSVCYTTHGLTAAQKNEILKAHNYFRQKVAIGGQTGQPGATNMKLMYWDNEIYTFAQNYTDTCPTGHNPTRKTTNYASLGENIYWTSATTVNLTAAVQAWYNEVSSFNSSSINPYVFSSTTGHYTQVVWADTYLIGCGLEYNSAATWKNTLVCDYYTPGNYIGNVMYKTGTKCTACATTPKVLSCSTTANTYNPYPGLCYDATRTPTAA